ncbi:MAG: citramalate synthase [Opitutaceae bacterium]|nr:citramalate synthase [Opitutaceae bacterium]
MRIHLFDTTLRDGLQCPGLVLRRVDRVRIASALVEAGVPLLEVGVPAMGATAVGDVRAVVRETGPERVVTWCRAREADLGPAAKTGAAGVHLSFPVSRIHMQAWRKSAAWVENELARLVSLGRNRFSSVSVGAQDASRADPAWLARFARMAREAGACRIRLADTVGILNPSSAAALTRNVAIAAPGLPIEIHCHNDLGLATANTLAALSAGATYASVTVNGIGERAGNASLEQVAVAAAQAYGFEHGVTLGALGPLCDRVARFTRIQIPKAAPIVGAHAFRHESGIHCAGLLVDPATYQPFPAEKVGRSPSTFVLGEKSGLSALQAACGRLGIRDSSPELLSKVRSLSRRTRRAVSDRTLVRLASTF